MQPFLLVAENLDTLPLLYAASNAHHLWDGDTVRTQHPGSVHADVSDLLLFFQKSAAFETMRDEHECFPREGWWALPQAHSLVYGLMGRVGATRLGRVMLTRLPAGKAIPPHVDSASQTQYYIRHHLCLCSPRDCLFFIEDEAIAMLPGQCWRVDNSREHFVQNNGETDRIALIVDVHVPVMAIPEAVKAESGKAPRRRSS